MTAISEGIHPTDLEGQAERDLEKQSHAEVVLTNRRAHLEWLLKEPMGRRELRRQLQNAGLNVHQPHVPDIIDRHHGQMCANAVLRAEGEQLLWSILRLTTSDPNLIGFLRDLFTETDDE